MNALAPALPLALAAVAAVAFARSLRRRGALCVLAAWWRGASPTTRAAALALFLSAVACGSDKAPRQFGQGLRSIPRLVASLCANAFTEAERQTGYAISAISTNETHDFAMPSNAVLAERIALRGAHRDGFWLRDSFTNDFAPAGLGTDNPVWIHTDGTVSTRTPAPELPIAALPGLPALSNATVYAPLQGSYGFLPASLWGTHCTSRVWTAVSPLGSRVVTWERALLDRDHTKPVSFQAEFSHDGKVAYRYDPPQTNFTGIGLYRGGMAQSFGLSDFLAHPDFQDLSPTNNFSAFQLFNLSTLTLSYVGDLGDGTGDWDGDGLTNWEEVKVHRTDPRRADTHGDGLDDYAEVNGGTDPLNPDTQFCSPGFLFMASP